MAVTTLTPTRVRAKRRLHYGLMLALILADVVGVNAGFCLAYQTQRSEILAQYRPPTIDQIVWALLGLNLVFSMTFWASSLYRMRRVISRIDETYAVFRTVSLASVQVIALSTLVPVLNITTRALVLGWLATLAFVLFGRIAYYQTLGWLRRRGLDTSRVLIVGADDVGQLVFRQLRKVPALGYRVVGFLSNQQAAGTSVIDNAVVLGKRHMLPYVLRTMQVDEIIIALSGAGYDEILALISMVEDESVAIKIYPDAFQLITNNEVSVGELNGLPLVSLRTVPLDRQLNRLLKRVMDIVISAAALIGLSPLLLLVALLVHMDSPGPVFFIQERVGRDGRPFSMIKFRSMRADAESQGTWTRPNDDRRTSLGTFIRRFSIDELPQFINVLVGDMSVVGPRPEQPQYVAQFSEQIPRYMQRHREKAGITGWAQVNGLRGDTSIEERTRYDLYYVENWSPLFDLKIVFRTAYNTLRGADNAY